MNDSRPTWEVLGSAAPETREAPLVTVRRVLRGRYRLVALAAAILGTLGAVAGYHAKPPRFVSQGLVRVDGALTPILYNSEENRVPPMFETFVAAQEAFLGSRTVLDDAVASAEMQAAGWGSGDAGVAALQRSLTITRGRKENLIAVAVTDRDAGRAQAAVNAVLTAFEINVIDPTSATISLKERTLIDRQSDLERRVRMLREEVIEISHQYGSEAVERIHAARVQELLALEEKLAALDPARAPDESGRVGVPSAASQRIAELEERENALVAKLTSLRGHYGATHPIITRLEQELETVQTRKTLSLQPPTMAAARRDELYRTYTARETALRSDIERLGRQLVEIAEIEARIRETSDLLWATRRRLDEIRVESGRDDMNRITVAARGDLPVVPISDRRAILTAAGFVFGCFGGGVAIFLLGLVDPRARHLDDLAGFDDLAPLLGAVPEIDESDVTRAAPFVHQIRNLLELQASDPSRNIFAVTSAERGEGRTSLSLALASSFAAAGRRTLIIDADLGRATLSREFGVADQAGLRDALRQPSSTAVHATERDGLAIMPAGSRGGLDATDLSHAVTQRLFESLRDEYDSIVVDTGSLTGSVETCAICAACDEVVMTIARGSRLARVRSAFGRLAQASVSCTGIVLNRARRSDLPTGDGAADRPAPRVAQLVAPKPDAIPSDLAPPAAPIPFVIDESSGDRKKAA